MNIHKYGRACSYCRQEQTIWFMGFAGLCWGDFIAMTRYQLKVLPITPWKIEAYRLLCLAIVIPIIIILFYSSPTLSCVLPSIGWTKSHMMQISNLNTLSRGLQNLVLLFHSLSSHFSLIPTVGNSFDAFSCKRISLISYYGVLYPFIRWPSRLICAWLLCTTKDSFITKDRNGRV